MIDSQTLKFISRELIELGLYADEDIHSSTTEIRVGSGIKKGLPDTNDASSISVILKFYSVNIADQKIIVALPTCGGKGEEWEFNEPRKALEKLRSLLL